MKKIIIVSCLFAIVPLLATAQPSIASLPTEQTEVPVTATRNLYAQLKAEKDFKKSHAGAENVRWYDDPNGYFIYYTNDGKRGRSFYSKKGRFVYDALSYPEKYLAPHLKDWVKSVYYNDYRITNVNEIHTLGQVVYFVQLTDGKTWEKIKIHNDEMMIVHSFKAK